MDDNLAEALMAVKGEQEAASLVYLSVETMAIQKFVDGIFSLAKHQLVSSVFFCARSMHAVYWIVRAQLLLHQMERVATSFKDTGNGIQIVLKQQIALMKQSEEALFNKFKNRLYRMQTLQVMCSWCHHGCSLPLFVFLVPEFCATVCWAKQSDREWVRRSGTSGSGGEKEETCAVRDGRVRQGSGTVWRGVPGACECRRHPQPCRCGQLAERTAQKKGSDWWGRKVSL